MQCAVTHAAGMYWYLPVCIGTYLKLVLRYEYQVLDTPYQDAVYLREDA